MYKLCLILYTVLIISVFFFFIYRYTETIEHNKPNSYELPKIIFCYWHNYEDDDFIKLFIENWKRKISPEWNIIVLHKNNVNEYTNGKMLKYNNLDNTKYSDFLRLYLLKEYGGVWMDITTIILRGDFIDRYHDEMIKNRYDCLMYKVKKSETEQFINTENWFIMAPKNSKLINELFDIFNKAFEMGFLKFKKDILIPSGLKLENTIGYEDDVYLLMYACLHYLMYKGKTYNILTKDSSESMLKFQLENNWDHDKFVNAFCEYTNRKNINDNIYAIKLTRNDRKKLDSTKLCNIKDILKG